MLNLKNVSVHLSSRRILNNIYLDVPRGCIAGIIGPNGAGKSTIMSVAIGDLIPSAGEVRLLDRPLRNWDLMDLARHRAVVSQSLHLDTQFTVEEIVALGRFPYRRVEDAKERIGWITQAMEMVGINTYRTYPYNRLSGGEKQRVQLARALAQILNKCLNDRVLLLDEPLNNLDIGYQRQLLLVLRALARKGVTVIIVLHDLNIAAFTDLLVLLRSGEVMDCGPAEKVLTPLNVELLFGQGLRLDALPSGRKAISLDLEMSK